MDVVTYCLKKGRNPRKSKKIIDFKISDGERILSQKQNF